MTEITLSPQQRAAADAVLSWYTSPNRKPVFRMFGYAGTGKTTVIKHVVERLRGRVEYAAFTGKAASVMRQYGVPTARTLHSLIFRYDGKDPVSQEPVFVKIHKQDNTADINRADLVVLDECSMVGGALAEALLSFDVPVLVLGDPAQLPPVQGGGSFTDAEPDAMLTDVHRQAAQSPVLQMATTVRSGNRLLPGTYGDSKAVFKASMTPSDLWDSGAQVLVAKNKTRRSLNSAARRHYQFAHAVPMFGERVICLKNNYNVGIFNGETFVVTRCDEDGKGWLSMDLIREGAEAGQDPSVEGVRVHSSFFTEEHGGIPDTIKFGSPHFDYAYAITVHKSQGSQWDDVVVYTEDWPFGEDRQRWMYTALTRAARNVTVML